MEKKRDSFNKQIEESGLVDSLKRVMLNLYEEADRSENPLEYIREYLGYPKGVDVEALTRENEVLKQQVAELEARYDQLRATIV